MKTIGHPHTLPNFAQGSDNMMVLFGAKNKYFGGNRDMVQLSSKMGNTITLIMVLVFEAKNKKIQGNMIILKIYRNGYIYGKSNITA